MYDASMTRIVDLWARLTEWANANAPDMLADLNAPATEQQISDLEQQLGLELPAAFKETLAIHNGEDDGWPCKVFADYGAFLSCEQILHNWRTMLELTEAERAENPDEPDYPSDVTGPAQPLMFHKAWMPIMNCNGDRIWALDFAPAGDGTPGQVIEFDWECDYLAVIAPSFEVFLDEYLKSLEGGEYEIIDGRPTREPEVFRRIEESVPESEAAVARKAREKKFDEAMAYGAMFLVLLLAWTIIRMIWKDADLRRWLLLVSTIASLAVFFDIPDRSRRARSVNDHNRLSLYLLLPAALGLYLLGVEGLLRLGSLADGFALANATAGLIYAIGGVLVVKAALDVFRLIRAGSPTGDSKGE